jgi:hypothetical protein
MGLPHRCDRNSRWGRRRWRAPVKCPFLLDRGAPAIPFFESVAGPRLYRRGACGLCLDTEHWHRLCLTFVPNVASKICCRRRRYAQSLLPITELLAANLTASHRGHKATAPVVPKTARASRSGASHDSDAPNREHYARSAASMGEPAVMSKPCLSRSIVAPTRTVIAAIPIGYHNP